MKRVLILGNGFDLAVGRCTSYKDFYNSMYCPKNYPSPLIKFLNGKWEDLDKIRWWDIERAIHEFAKTQSDDYFDNKQANAFSQYCNIPFIPDVKGTVIREMIDEGLIPSKGKDLSGLRYIYDEFFSKGKEYREKKSYEQIGNGLAKYLTEKGEVISRPKDKNAIDALNLLRNYLDDVNSSVFSFNYTSVGKLLETDENKINNYDSKVKYMHGSLKDGYIIVGAKDGEYDKNKLYMQKSFNPNYQPPSLAIEMASSDRIDIYGHSLGDSDSKYFESFLNDIIKAPISNHGNVKEITIYTLDNDSEMSIKENLNKITNYNLQLLQQKCKLIFIKSIK